MLHIQEAGYFICIKNTRGVSARRWEWREAISIFPHPKTQHIEQAKDIISCPWIDSLSFCPLCPPLHTLRTNLILMFVYFIILSGSIGMDHKNVRSPWHGCNRWTVERFYLEYIKFRTGKNLPKLSSDGKSFMYG